MPGPARAGGSRFHAVVTSAMVVALGGIGWLWTHPPRAPSRGVWALTFPAGKDFCNLFTVARMAADGVPLAEAYDSARYARYQSALLGADLPDGYYVWSYPPSMSFFALPLAGLPYMTALLGWLAGTLALLVLATRALRLPRRDALLLALSPAAVLNVYFGHVGFLLAALVLAGFAWLERRPLLAGVCFGLASVKPQLLLMVPFLLLGRRAFRTLLAAAVTVAALVVASGLAFGWQSWSAFATQAVVMQRYFLHMPAPADDEAIPLFQLLLVTPFFALRMLGAGLTLSHALQGLCALVAAGLALRLGASAASTRKLAAWAAVGAFLASPYAMAYDLVLLAAACLLVEREGVRSVFVPLAWLLPLLAVVGNYLRVPLAPLVLAGFALAVHRASRSQPSLERVHA